MKTISFRANEEVQDYIKLLCDEELKSKVSNHDHKDGSVVIKI